MAEPGTDRRTLRAGEEPGDPTTPEGGKERIDRFLGRQWSDLSRSRIEGLIKAGAVLVDGKVPKPSQPVRPGQQIEIVVPPLQEPAADPEPIPLDVVYEDAALIVVNKPAGMVVHPAAGHPSGTLVNALLHHCGDLSGIGGVLRPGIVHRLDKDTSGLIVVAKTQQAHMALSEALRRREVRREYLALVWGSPAGDEGTIETWIARSRSDRKRMAAYTERSRPLKRRWGRPAEEEAMLATRAAMATDPNAPFDDADEDMLEEEGAVEVPYGVPTGARRAITHYAVEERFGIATLLHCRLETGRTHQVRVHLQHLGHTVVGDPVYGGRESALKGMIAGHRDLARKVLDTMPGQALHAVRLTFKHPISGGEMEFSCSRPPDFQAAAELLRS